MSTPRATLADWLDLTEATSAAPAEPTDDEFFAGGDDRQRGRDYAIEEAEAIGLWCFVTRQDDRAWHRLTRLERNAMADAITRAQRRR